MNTPAPHGRNGEKNGRDPTQTKLEIVLKLLRTTFLVLALPKPTNFLIKLWYNNMKASNSFAVVVGNLSLDPLRLSHHAVVLTKKKKKRVKEAPFSFLIPSKGPKACCLTLCKFWVFQCYCLVMCTL